MAISDPFLGDAVLFACPVCGGDLAPSSAAIACAGCGRRIPVEEGIPRAAVPDDDPRAAEVGRRVGEFYEVRPFPDYDDLDSRASLCDKAKRSRFARLLDEQVAHDARILEAGCGTGQLSNFLALTWGRRVFGADLSLASLTLAESFRRAHAIERAAFWQMNLFRPAFRDGVFDLVIANGVLHHTADPRRGLATLARLLRPGGHIVVGLYNRYGRLFTDARRAVFRATGGRWRGLDPYLRRKDVGERKKEAWFADQYCHPHETSHSLGEALRWFDDAGLEFVSGIPGPSPLAGRAADAALFDPRPRGGALGHAVVQLGMVLAGGREGGFFVLIGRRP